MCLGYQKSGTASYSPKGKLSKHEKQQCHLHSPVKKTTTFLNTPGSPATSNSSSARPHCRNTLSWRRQGKLISKKFLHSERICQLFVLENKKGKYMQSRQIRPSLSLTSCKHELVLLDADLHFDSRASLWVCPTLAWTQPFFGTCQQSAEAVAFYRSQAGEQRKMF